MEYSIATSNRIVELATRVITESGRANPADAVLRRVFKGERALPREAARAIAQAVFSYYRWWGWVPRGERLAAQIKVALSQEDRFRKNPSSFSDEELLAKAVPEWTRAEVEVTPAWVRTLQSPAPIWLRTKRGLGAQVAARLGDCQVLGEGPLGDCLKYDGHRDLFRAEDFQSGNFELQDLSSQLVGLICEPQEAEKWWDACAGEGGKTLHLSDLMGNRGLILASDRSMRRLQTLRRRAARSKAFNYRLAVWDGGPNLPVKTKFDGVLLDAPCTAIGTWRRNPHARWTTTPQDIVELSEIQRGLIRHAVPALKEGGRLIYSVCTLTRAETFGMSAFIQQELPGLVPLEAKNPLAPSTLPQTSFLLRPEETDGNGMFVSVWRKQ
jgi:16S rRNA (cytosine967-C5)-methyltransferase